MGYPIHVIANGGWPKGAEIVEHKYHFFEDRHFSFLLSNGNMRRLGFEEIVAVHWIAVGGLFVHDVIHSILKSKAGANIQFLMSTLALRELTVGGIDMPNLDNDFGMLLDKAFKEKVRKKMKSYQ